MEQLINSLKLAYPEIHFTQSDQASWSHAGHQVCYRPLQDEHDSWPVFHELGHALLGHSDFSSDVDLLTKERQAWQKALEIADAYGVAIEAAYIEDCLDTYRDWVHKRSTCPACGSHGLQLQKSRYSCPNCQFTWKVTSRRLCRPYRLKMAHTQK